MERTQYDREHEYIALPKEYSISANEAHSTYDQFIQLRDTLIFTGKYYNDKASKKLCVGDKGDGTTTNTIEVWENNIFRQGFEPNWATDPEHDVAPYTKYLPNPDGKYVTAVPTTLDPSFLSSISPLCCMIQKDGHYRILHKEEILPTATTNKIYCYVDVYRQNGQGAYEIPQNMRGGIAVFDWEGNTTLNTSGTQPNGTVAITLGLLFKKVTAMSYMEKDLKKGDILVLRMRDADKDPSTGEPQGNNLVIQASSNYWSIEYLDLPYNI